MKTLRTLLERNAAWFPDRPAFVLGDERRSYGDFNRRGARLASALEKAGVSRQARIGIYSTNSIEYFEIFAAAEIGAFVATPITFRGAPPEIEYLLTDSGTSVLFFEHGFAAVVDGLRQRLPNIFLYVCIGGDVPEWAQSFEAFLASGDANGPVNRPEPDDFAYLFYTSGTTGRPKGVPMTHASQMASAHSMANLPDLNLLQISPAFHVRGRGPSLGAYWVGGVSAGRNLPKCAG